MSALPKLNAAINVPVLSIVGSPVETEWRVSTRITPAWDEQVNDKTRPKNVKVDRMRLRIETPS
jgi:hypothetical protein